MTDDIKSIDLNSQKFESYPGVDAVIDAIVKNGGQLRKMTRTLSEKRGQKIPYQYVRKWIKNDPRLKAAMKRAQAVYVKDRMANLNRAMAIKRRILHEQAVLKHRTKSFALKHYSVNHDGVPSPPHKKQSEFHVDPSQGRVISGANRSGKTMAGGAEFVAHSLGFRPWLPVEDPNYKVKVRVPNKGLIVGESFQEQVKKVLLAKLLGNTETGDPGLIPKHELVETKKNPQGIITYIRLKNGSTIYIQSYDQDVDLFESADYDFVWFDEPPPRSIFISIMRGLTDRRGRYWFTMTPLKEPWIYDEIYDNDTVGLHYFDIQDNVGYGLTQEGVDQFAAKLTDDEKEARLHGRYFHLTGLVYKSFSKDIHLKRRDRVLRLGNGKVPRHWGLWMHIDTHPQTPHHSIWVAIDQHQRKYVVGELKNGDVLNRIGPFCEAMKVYEREFLGRYGDSIVRLIDPLSKVLDPGREDAKCMGDIFADNGFRCSSGSKNRDAAILLFQNELNYDLTLGHFPNLFILDDLPGIRFEMTHYIWDDHQNAKAAERLAEKNKPRKKNDHFIEGIHRILLDEPYCSIEPEENLREQLPVAAGASKVTGY